MNLAEILKKENIFVGTGFEDTESFYGSYSLFLKERGIINDSDVVKRLFVKRENVHSTAIGKGAAAPHIFSDQFSEFLFSVALLREPLDFKAPDDKKVHFVFLLMSGERDVGKHLKALAHIARLVSTTTVMEEMKKAMSEEEIHLILKQNESLI